MSSYLANLVSRTFQREAALQPVLAPLFAPAPAEPAWMPEKSWREEYPVADEAPQVRNAHRPPMTESAPMMPSFASTTEPAVSHAVFSQPATNEMTPHASHIPTSLPSPAAQLSPIQPEAKISAPDHGPVAQPPAIPSPPANFEPSDRHPNSKTPQSVLHPQHQFVTAHDPSPSSEIARTLSKTDFPQSLPEATFSQRVTRELPARARHRDNASDSNPVSNISRASSTRKTTSDLPASATSQPKELAVEDKRVDAPRIPGKNFDNSPLASHREPYATRDRLEAAPAARQDGAPADELSPRRLTQRSVPVPLASSQRLAGSQARVLAYQQPESHAEPTIEVTIGKIEVRAAPEVDRRQREPAASTLPSLADYLRKRSGQSRHE